jgi:hypothetical protein
LKPGQILRLGTVELKLDAGAAVPGAASAPANAAPDAPAKAPLRKAESTMVVPRGVSLTELESGGRPPAFDTTAFSKKRNRAGIYFWVAAGVVVVVIVVLLLVALNQIPHGK